MLLLKEVEHFPHESPTENFWSFISGKKKEKKAHKSGFFFFFFLNINKKKDQTKTLREKNKPSPTFESLTKFVSGSGCWLCNKWVGHENKTIKQLKNCKFINK